MFKFEIKLCFNIKSKILFVYVLLCKQTQLLFYPSFFVTWSRQNAILLQQLYVIDLDTE